MTKYNDLSSLRQSRYSFCDFFDLAVVEARNRIVKDYGCRYSREPGFGKKVGHSKHFLLALR